MAPETTAPPEPDRPNLGSQRISAWSGVLFVVMFSIGMVALAQFVPPPKASDSAQEIVRLYAEDADRVRAGLVLMMLSCAFFAPWGVTIALQMKRIEGRFSPMAWTVIACTGANVIAIGFPEMIMLAASFRPEERAAEITQALNDLAWLPFIMFFPPTLVQCLAIGIAIINGGEQNVFPRWVAYFNFWIAIGLMPSVMIPFFKTGPFSWHGIFEFWLAAVVFFAWVVVMTVALLGAIRRQGEDSPAAA